MRNNKKSVQTLLAAAAVLTGTTQEEIIIRGFVAIANERQKPLAKRFPKIPMAGGAK